MGKGTLRILTVVLVLVLSIGGCGGGDADPTASSTTPAPPTGEASPAAGPPIPLPTAAPATALLAAEPSAAPGGADAEPNDEEAQASPVPAGSLQGVLPEGDEDWYSFDVAAGSVLTVSFTPSNNVRPLSIALQDAGGGQVWSENSVAKGATAEFSWIEGPGGVFKAHVSGGPGDYTMVVVPESQDDAGTGRDAGGVLADAVSLSATQSVAGLLGDADTEDWYAVEVPDGSIVDVAFTPGDGARDLAVAFMDPGQDVIWDEYDVDAEARSTRWVVSGDSGGPHYLQVSDGHGTYGIDVRTVSQDDAGSGGDAGGDLGTALEVEPDAAIRGMVGDSDREDWYVLEVRGGSILTVALAPAADAEDMAIQLRDYEESRLWDAYDVTVRRPATVTKLIPADEGGAYAVGVSGTGAYTLDVTIEPQDDGGSGGDAAGDIGEAVEIAERVPFAGQVGDLDYSDWYTFDVDAGSVLTVSITPDAGAVDLEVGLRDPEDSLIDDQTVARGRSYTATVVVGPEMGGFWAIEIYAGTGRYAGQVDVEAQDDAGSGGDAGDQVVGAVALAVGNSYQGIIGDTDADDWYTFELPAGKGVIVTLEGGPGARYLSLNLRDADEALIGSVQGVREGEAESIALDARAGGTYYLDVGPGGGGYSEYTLIIEEG